MANAPLMPTPTVVAYDYDAARAVPLPDAWRQRITAYEPALANDEEPRIQ